jgi:hypothetical protein
MGLWDDRTMGLFVLALLIRNKNVGWVNGFQYRCFKIRSFNYQKTVIYSK